MNALTISDVYKPLTAAEILRAMELGNQMESNKVRNRLLTMQEQDYIGEREQRRGMMDAVVGGYGKGLPSVNSFISPGSTDVSQPIDRPSVSETKAKSLAGHNLASYAQDPNQFASVSKIYYGLSGIQSVDQADKYIQSKAPGSPITGQMVFEAARQHNTDPRLMLALFEHESRFGTAGLATKTRNPGNIGGDNPSKEFYKDDWGAGVNLTAGWLDKHRDQGQRSSNALMSPSMINASQERQPIAPGSREYQYGQITGRQKLSEIDQARTAAVEKARSAKFKETMQWWLPAYRELLKSGDDKRFKEFLDTSAQNPMLRPIVEQLRGMTLTGPMKGAFTGNLDRQKLDEISQLASTADMIKLIRGSSPGPYEIKFEKGKIVEFKPSTQKDMVGREAVYAKLKSELGREPTSAELDEAQAKQSKEGKASQGKMTKMGLAVARAQEELTKKGENRAPTPSEVTKALMDINREESKSRLPEGADEDSVANWGPEKLQIAFERALMGSPPKFTGMRATFNQQAFESRYLGWLAENGLSGYEAESIKKEFVAKSSSLRDLEKNRTFIDQSIKQADKNAVALLHTSKAFTRSNYPAPNKIINWWSKNFGSVERQSELGQFGVALLAFSREYMKVVTGSARSVAELSLGAQATADEILSKFDSWKTLEAKVNQARIEMENTNKSNIEEIEEVSRSMRNPKIKLDGSKVDTGTKHGKGKLDPNNQEHRRLAEQYYFKAGKNKEKARELARQDGWEF